MLSYCQHLARRATPNSAHQYVLEMTLTILLEALSERKLPVSLTMLEHLGRNLDDSVPLQILSGIHHELQTNPKLTRIEQKILLLALVTAEETLATYSEPGLYKTIEKA